MQLNLSTTKLERRLAARCLRTLHRERALFTAQESQEWHEEEKGRIYKKFLLFHVVLHLTSSTNSHT